MSNVQEVVTAKKKEVLGNRISRKTLFSVLLNKYRKIVCSDFEGYGTSLCRYCTRNLY